MKVLELQFNPRGKKGQATFDSFSLFPQTNREHRLGKLYLAGQIELDDKNKHIRSGQAELLEKMANILQEEYYTTLYDNSEDALKHALFQINSFLTYHETANINFTALALTPHRSIYFSQIGKMIVLLLRKEEMFDIGSTMTENVFSHKKFPSVAHGDLEEKDRILILNQSVFEYFKENEILQNLLAIDKYKETKQFFKEKKQDLRNLNGLCLIIWVKKERKKIFLNLHQASEHKQKVASLFLKLSRKTFLRFEAPEEEISTLGNKIFKGIFYLLVLISLIILGTYLF